MLELAERGDQFDKPERDRIQGLVQDLMSGDHATSYAAAITLASQVGPYSVPYLVEALSDRRDDNRRVKAITMLSRLGTDGTNAVIELLYHNDEFVRQNACAILGNIRDIKAIPYLKAMMERPSESNQLKAAADRALKNITGKNSQQLDDAFAFFGALADRYYLEHPTVTINNFREWTVWNWSDTDNELKGRAVPHYAWNDEMSENVCYDALDHARRVGASNSKLTEIYTILLSAHFSEVVEVDKLIEVADVKASTGNIDNEAYQELKDRRGRVANLRSL
ncbi:MAG: HEAT repeat domain-containing protein, partial [Planctomycetota bacterium]